MTKIDKNFAIIIVLGVLIFIPIAYYYWYALPEYNKQKLNFEKEKYYDEITKEEERLKKMEAEKIVKEFWLENCLTDAGGVQYLSDWENECKAWKYQVDDEWNDCRWRIYSWETDEENKTRCKTSTSDYTLDENWNCLLPKNRSEKVEEMLKERKDECYRKFWN